MDVRTINQLLSRGEIDREGMWPHLNEMKGQAIEFDVKFGLEKLPMEPGLITIRGPRQYGKSTWLERVLRETIHEFGKGSAYYLNGDEIASPEAFVMALEELATAYQPGAAVKRLFIDEVTAIPLWEKGIKRLLDRGGLRDVLVVTTGSKAMDLRRGSERLPGRKGRLVRSDYIFLPVSYEQFYEKARDKLGVTAWKSYLLTGGSPLACNELYRSERIPEYFIQLMRDWLFGEMVASGRSRMALANLLQVLFRYGGQAVGYAKLAREGGLANNTVAAGYMEQLADLFCVLPAWSWDPGRKILQCRKPCKFHFVNLAAVTALHPSGLRSVHDFEALPQEEQGKLIEWSVAQEIWRRNVLRGADNPEAIGFWQSKEHEIDFVAPDGEWYEVKRGQAGPLDFGWFPKVFPKGRLTVICKTPFDTAQVHGVSLEDFLLGRA